MIGGASILSTYLAIQKFSNINQDNRKRIKPD